MEGALVQARVAVEFLEQRLRAEAVTCKASVGGDNEDAWPVLEAAADGCVGALKSLLDVKVLIQGAALRGWDAT